MGISKVTVETVYCDRCGSEKDTRDANEREWGHTFLTYKGGIGSRDMWGNAGGVNHKGDDIYICLPCTKEFLVWLDKPKKYIRESYITAPPNQKPLSDDWIKNNIHYIHQDVSFTELVRAVEKAHGIGVE